MGHEPGEAGGEYDDEVRFMGSGLGAGAMLTGHEPGIPEGETPAATEARFMPRGVTQRGTRADGPW
jgi:hypothetical protein